MKNYRKAIAAAIIAGIGGLAVGYADDVLRTGELWAALAAAATAGGAVFGIRNGDRPGA